MDAAALVLSGAAVIVAGFCLRAALRAPAVLSADAVKTLHERVGTLAAELETERVARTRYKAEVEGLLEAIEENVEVAERKRRRAVSRETREAEAAARSIPPELELVRRARAQGHPV